MGKFNGFDGPLWRCLLTHPPDLSNNQGTEGADDTYGLEDLFNGKFSLFLLGVFPVHAEAAGKGTENPPSSEVET